MNTVKKLLFSALLTQFPAARAAHASEFEVLDRFSADGYTVLRGSADIPGGSFTVGGSTLVVKNGNVGIGTASPGGKLEARDTVENTAATVISGKLYINHTANGTYYNTASQAFVSPVVAAGVTSSGYIRALHSMALRNYASIGDSGSVANLNGMTLQYGHYNSDGMAAPATDNAYGIEIQPYSVSGTITNMYDLFLGSPASGGTVTNHWGVYQKNTFPNYFAGNIGIGTTNPSAKIDVRNLSAAGTYAYFGASSDGGARGLQFTSSDNGIYLGAIHKIDATSAYGVIDLATAGATRLHIDSTGNIGVGTASPGAKLHAYVVPAAYSTVDDVLRLTSKFESVGNAASAAIGSGPAIVFSGGIGDNQTRDRARIVAVYEGYNVSGLAFHTQNTADLITEKVRIQNNGNVGIGTTGPGYKLDINGTLGVAQPATFSNTVGLFGGSAQLYIGSAGTAGNFSTFIWNDTNKAIEVTGTYAGGAPDMTIKSGKVGIGTTAPGAKLDVAGTLNFNSTVWTSLGTADLTGLVANTWYDIDEWDWNDYGTFMLKIFMNNQDAGNGYQQTSITLFTLQGVNTSYAGVHSNEEVMNTVSHTQSPVTITARYYCSGGPAMHLQIKLSFVNAAAISNGLSVYTRKF